ncbi:MAG: response regulator [Desulfobacteraceae bacterium]|nr:response regulator [Desulfobacteraceae bacterium]
MRPTLLVADDEKFILELITAYLDEENYKFVTAENGIEAWNLLEKSPDDFDAVILDRMMPGMNGMEVLAKMKAHKFLKKVPVIFQTGMIKDSDILEGLDAGVDYYITKPFNSSILVAVIKTALSNYFGYRSMWENIKQTTNALALMKSGCFEFQTLEEARMLTSMLSSLCPEPDRASTGLWELLLNAVEHGNLGITYEEKKDLMEKDEWKTEVERRMLLSENTSKKVVIKFESLEDDIRFLIRDQGQGFDWHPFMELSSERAFDPNGRGIHMARLLSFDQIKYIGEGNEVMAVVRR